MTTPDTLPVVTPYLLRRADDMCPRRLAMTFDDTKGTQGAFTRWRLRYPLVEGAHAAHAELRPPERASFVAPADLLHEEVALFERAADTYCRVFAGEPVEAVRGHPGERRTESKRFGVIVGGAVDLLAVGPEGDHELRQFELWGRELCADPGTSWEMLLAALRVSKVVGEAVLRIRHVDLLTGALDERLVDLRRQREGLVRRFEDRLDLVRQRADKTAPEEGQDCGSCPHVPLCEVHW